MSGATEGLGGGVKGCACARIVANRPRTRQLVQEMCARAERNQLQEGNTEELDMPLSYCRGRREVIRVRISSNAFGFKARQQRLMSDETL